MPWSEVRNGNPGRVYVRYFASRALHSAVIDEVWSFFSRFVVRDRAAFIDGLRETDEVMLARDMAGALCGFAAISTFEVLSNGARNIVIYTHWSAVAPEHRGKNLIPKSGLRCFLHQRLRHPTLPIYWIFGASTYKSYLLLPRYYRDYWPRPGAVIPAYDAEVLQQTMAILADPKWDAQAGVVRRYGVSRYREGVVDDEPHAAANPDVRFYAEQNPGQAQGDTLLCVCPLTARNLRSIGAAMLARALGKRAPSNRA